MKIRILPLLLAAGLAACDSTTEVKTAAHLDVFSGGSQTGILGQALAAPVVVLATNASGKPVRGVAVAWTATNGTISSAASVTDADGHASATWTLAPGVANQSIIAAAAGAPPVMITAHGRPALPAVITSCETNTATLCSDWHLLNGQYVADWTNGSHAIIIPTVFELDSVVFTRDDPSGTSAGMHAVYRGAPTNGTISPGMVTWTDTNHFSFNGRWDAHW